MVQTNEDDNNVMTGVMWFCLFLHRVHGFMVKVNVHKSSFCGFKLNW